MNQHQINPIKNKEQLFKVVKRIHLDCYNLCEQVIGKYLSNSGNMGVFCHDSNEYELLTKARQELTHPSDDPNQKYYLLKEPIVIPSHGEVPKATYTHLYIRKPDPTPYGQYLGDVDFVMELDEYAKLKNSILSEKEIEGIQIYNRPGWDTIQITDPQINSVAYISTMSMAVKARIKFD